MADVAGEAARGRPLRSLIASLPVAAAILAAIESIPVRLELEQRPHEPALFVQAFLLWAVFGLLALVPAWVTLRWVAARAAKCGCALGRGAAFVVQLGWMAIPVAMHAVLDRHTRIEGNIDRLLGPRPWLELAGVVLVAFLLLWGIARLLRGTPTRALALFASVLAVAAGLLLPLPSESPSAGDAGESPNLLLLVWDTCRSDRLQPYGFERETTPHLARLAEDAYVFEDVLSTSVFTLTSHFSLLTGTLPSSHGVRLTRVAFDPVRTRSVAEVLRREGYRTAAFVGTDVLNGRTGVVSGFEVYDDLVDPQVCETHAWKLVHDLQSLSARVVPALRNNGRPHWIEDFQRPASEVLERALTWIERDDPRPWFCLVNLYDIHWPYVPEGAGRELVRDYDGPLDGHLFRSDAWQKGYELTEEDRRHVTDLYEAELQDLDREVDGFLRALRLEVGDTAVLLTSDHGEAFGEAGRWKHEDITEPQVRVPLIVRPAGARPEGRRVQTPASGIDVAPTLLGLAGLSVPASMEGIDLLSAGEEPGRVRMVEDRDHIALGDVRVALYSGPWKLVRRGLGDAARYELFDLGSDPIGEHDVKAEHPDVLLRLAAELESRREAADVADASTETDLGGQADALRALGYAGEDEGPD